MRPPKDSLSDLPDAIIIHILSFLNTKNAFQTSILSTRWKYFPYNLPTLKLSSTRFKSVTDFTKLTSRILSLRNHSISLNTLNFMCYDDYVEPKILKSIVEYAVSHNVQLLRIAITCNIQQFPPCLFSCQTLMSLHLSVHSCILHKKISFPNSMNLPALTNLSLKFFYFYTGDDGCIEPFSAFNKLNTLILEHCSVWNEKVLCISSTSLVNLTIYGYGYCHESYKCKVSAPSLCNFAFTGTLSQELCQSHLCYIKHLYINLNVRLRDNRLVKEDSAVLLSWLLQLANIKSLTVSSNTLQVLSFVPDLFKVKLTSLCNLESVQLNMRYAKFKVIPDGVLDFLLQNSPCAKVKIRK